MIIVRLWGGLGNQFYLYATARAVAHRLNTTLKLDITFCQEGSHHAYYRLGEFNIEENFATLEEIETVRGHNLIKEAFGGNAFTPEVLNCSDNTFLEGQFINPVYFNHIADTLREEFTPKNIHPVSNSWKDKILAAECSVSAHIRLGDYCIPFNRTSIPPMEYYEACVNALKNDYPNLTVFVFSDDLDWVRDNVDFGFNAEFVTGCETDAEEWYLMSLCHHNIIASSTFSSSAALINSHPDKKVFTQGLRLADSWIFVTVNNGRNSITRFPPALSVIVYVDNDISKCQLTVSSIVAQNINDYEIIVLDASRRNAETNYRQLTANDNVTFIKLDNDTERYSAWNKGLECARGDYVIFLSGGDFVFSNMILQFLHISSRYFWQYSPKGLHVTHKNYEQIYIDNASNVFCSIQHIEEDFNGSLSVNGLPDRKFDIVVDGQFQDLRDVQEFNFDDEQKLVMLGNRQLNKLLGTKFFKRKFLNEHGIRFDAAQQQGGGCCIEISHRRVPVDREYNSRPATVLRAA